MKEEIAKFQWAIILALVGLILYFMAYRVYYNTAGRKRRCKEVVDGVVVHDPLGDGLGVQPFVEYFLDGQKKRISIFRRAFLDSMNDDARTNRDARKIVHELVETKYKAGAVLPVFINPKNREEAFLEKDFRQGGKGMTWWALAILGTAAVATALYTYFG